MRFLQYLTSFLVSLAISAAILPAIIRLARRWRAVDQGGGRRIHDGEIPRLGGIAIFLGLIGGVGAALLVAGRAHSIVGSDYNHPWHGTAVGLVLIFLAGLLDDLYQYRAHTKLALQVLAAGTAVSTGMAIEVVNTPFGGSLELGMLGPVAAFAWILLVTNALNLIDGLDGLAGGVALIVTTTVASVALAQDQFAVVISAVALAGAVLGFLIYNFAPARIFMGDCGSQLLGFTLAVISIRGAQKGPTAIAISVPLLVLGLPLLDLVTTIARRARRDSGAGRGPVAMLRRVSQADREHLHHDLLDLGLSPGRAALALHLITALFALSGYLTVAHNSLVLAGFTLALSLGSVIVIKLVVSGVRSPEVPRRIDGGTSV